MSGILNAFTGGTYSGPPGAPTIGTATATSYSTATVAFTAPTNTGGLSITGYQTISTPGCITATGANSPITVSGLSPSTSYTFKVRAQNAIGYGAYSGSSNSITTPFAGSVNYTSPGTYTFVVPSCVSSISAVVVSGGDGNPSTHGGKGGSLGWVNNYSVSSGCSFSVTVGAGGCVNTSTGGKGSVIAKGAPYLIGACNSCGYFSCLSTSIGGGLGGSYYGGAGGGAGGYSGNGGNAGFPNGNAGSGGGGGGGSGCICSGGGGVGIFGQGVNGAANGGGGSGGTNGTTTSAGVYGGGSRIGYRGGNGAVRIVYPGTTRQFPSTSVGSP
jgi:hypothetical protein